MKIRQAAGKDLGRIMEIYAYARKFMAENGNGTQWGNNRPSQAAVENDIEAGQSFVGVDDKGKIHFVFAFILGKDPTYAVIENGSWLNEKPYGVIHRIAGDGQVHGVLRECVGFCLDRCDNLRIDTHENNKIMQHLLAKNGFVKCGIIYLENGDPRIAYQKQRIK